MHLLRRLQAASLVVAAVVILPVFRAEEISSTKVLGTQWGATKWAADDLELFGGRPTVMSDRANRLVVRYSYFVSEYNVLRKNPVWVAHIDTKESAAAMKERKGGDWKRDGIPFKPDENVVALARQLKLDWVKHSDYTNSLAPGQREPVAQNDKHTRGHMASNVEMKSQGDVAAGKASQLDSFSLANVAPQIQRHNGGIWQEIEGDCIRVAQKWERVAVVSGPIFTVPFGQRFRMLNADSPTKVEIPIPTHFFKVLIVRIEGRVAALAYIVPHDPTLKPEDRFDYVKSVREVESLTGINLMPSLGENGKVERKPSALILDFLKENQNSPLPWEKQTD